MTYTYLTPNELVIIEAYFHQETPVAFVAKKLKRGRQAIYNVYHFLKQGKRLSNTSNSIRKIKNVVEESRLKYPKQKKNTSKTRQLKAGPRM